jgi:hypothetical protein
LAVLSDGKTLLAMMRMDGGDGCSVGPPGCVTEHKPYYKATSTTQGKSWSFPVAVPGTGAARPRLAQLGSGAGSLVLTGGRALNLGTRDILMWINADGMGEHWTRPVSISYWHNRLARNHTDRFTKYVNCSSATPSYGACSKLPGGGGSESSGYTTVLWLGGRSGIVTYDRELNETAPGIFEGHNSMTYSMRFHLGGQQNDDVEEAARSPGDRHDPIGADLSWKTDDESSGVLPVLPSVVYATCVHRAELSSLPPCVLH